jgi:glucose-6-phosphate 1-dehydrogenase
VGPPGYSRLMAPDSEMARLLVVFGSIGDLARRKIFPALYNLAHDGELPERFAVVGYARSEGDDDSFRARARQAITEFSRRRIDEAHWQRLARSLFYVRGGFDEPEGFARLSARLAEIETQRHAAGRVYYCATPPDAVPVVVRGLAGLGAQRGARIVLEKPVGRDLATARALHGVVSEVFDESQVLRIDHFLGKDTVQNILVFRFANPLIEHIWNGRAIEHVQLTVAESIGVEHRGGYYETAGALRDMLQNHLLQVLAFLTMEHPGTLGGESARDATAALLAAVRPLDPGDVVRGQYRRGVVEGHEVPGYRHEDGVAAGSATETFVAARAWIGNDRWAGVPFFLRTGKRLARRATEVVVELREVADPRLFGDELAAVPCNSIIFQLEPEPGITIAFRAKEPGPGLEVQTVPMRFSYQ